MKKIYQLSLFTCCLLLIVFVSCKKTKDEQVQSRMFQPAGVISATSYETNVKLTWKIAVNADSTKVTYTVIVSDDSLFAAGPKFTYITDTSGVTLGDDSLTVRRDYYARVKTNGLNGAADSKWLNSSRFRITGQQIFYPVKDIELKETSVILKWMVTTGVTRITLTPSATGGTPVNYTISAAESAAGVKTITGLTPNTQYSAEIFDATRSKGFLTFTTRAAVTYSFVLTPTANLVTVIDTCSPNAVIGLNPGTYTSGATTAFVIKQKGITLKSTSGNPFDTKVVFKEFTLKGTGAGLALDGIDFEGGGSTSNYFINLTGLASDGEAATFTSINVNNCYIHNYTNCILRGNRGTNTADHKIGDITVRNCLVYDNTLGSFYSEFTLDKLQFSSLNVLNSTLYRVGQTLVSCATTITGTIPVIKIDGCTVNSFGANAKYAILDANANPVSATITNNIFANTPRTGTVNAAHFRASGTGSTVLFSYNNSFALSSGTADLVLPTTNTTAQQNRNINLGWNTATNTFNLPTGSELKVGGSTGGPIGDPRWAY